MRQLIAGAFGALLLAGPVNAQVITLTGAVSSVVSYIANNWPVNAPTVFVRVTGEGATKDSALDNAFKNATQKATGVVFSTEIEAVNSHLVRDEIVQYTSGFISSFEIISEKKTDAGYQLEITAKVAGNKIAKRLLGRNIEQQTVGAQSDQIYGQVSSTLNERRAGDALLTNLVNDYPRNSFIVAVDKPKFEIDQNRNTVITIQASIKWATQYLEALEETVQYVSNDTCSAFRRCENSVRFNKGYLDKGRFSSYVLSDNQQADIVSNGFPAQIMFELKISDMLGHSAISCVPINLSVTDRPFWEQLIKKNEIDNNTEFFKNDYQTVVVLPINNVRQIKNIQQIEARVVKNCQ
jgi:hypothetical protein